MGVDLCGREATVSEQRLDEARIRAVLQHVGRTGMTEQVTGALRVYTGLLDVVLHRAAQVIVGKRVAVRGQEQESFIADGHELRAHVVDVLLHPHTGPLTEWNDSVFSAL